MSGTGETDGRTATEVTVEGFEQFYRTELRPVLEELEGRRRRVLQTGAIAAAAVLGGGALAVTAGLSGASGNALPFLVVGGVVGLIVAIACVSAASRRYTKEFKERVIGAIVRFCDPGLHYEPAGSIPRDVFRGSRIFQHSIDRYSGEDCVRGTVGATAVEFSELHAEYKTTSTDSKGHTQTHWHTIFRGLFFTADFNKHFRTATVVLPDVAERAFGWLGQKLQGLSIGRADLVKLEDPEFEREFVVYGEDQVEARYILSTSLMQRILEFRRRAGCRISLSFVGSRVYVAVPCSRNMFEPRLLRGAPDLKAATEYLRDLQFALGIVEDLDLNTRIWSKQ
ncbi:MAG: DUF3137 domain-containing protein [Candidatus Brocadiaceae bacterium]|nr:DUF3137 domain-containing protein [Candidatus Brocadiaceae bacterium]